MPESIDLTGLNYNPGPWAVRPYGPYSLDYFRTTAGLPAFTQDSSENEYVIAEDRPYNEEFTEIPTRSEFTETPIPKNKLFNFDTYSNLDWVKFPQSSDTELELIEDDTSYNNNQSSSTSNNSMAADYRSGQSIANASGGYQTKINNIIKEVQEGRMDPAEGDARIAELQRQEFGASSFDIGEFEGLLGRLEGSKMRQQRQKSVEGRRDIMQQGLASMMSNF